MTLAPAGLFSTTKRADVQVTLLPGARPLRDRSRVHFHCYTAEVIAEVVLLSQQLSPTHPTDTEPVPQLAPGGTAWAQLRFREPLLLFPGDRFILRQFSPVVTVGGGIVVDAAPLPLRAVHHDELELRLAQLAKLAEGHPAEQWMTRISRQGERGLSLAQTMAETGWTRQEMANLLPSIQVPLEQVKLPPNWRLNLPKPLPVQGKTPPAAFPSSFFSNLKPGAVRLGDILVENTKFLSSQIRMLLAVVAFHKANPLVAGIGKEELREKLELPPEVFAGVLEALIRDKQLQVAGEQVSEAGRGVVMKDEEADSKRRIEAAFATAGLKVPALKEVLAGLTVDRSRAQQIVTLLLRDRTLIKVSEDLVFHRSALEQLRQQMTEYKKTSSTIDVGKFKDLAGITRKYAIPLLEYLDREHVTRRQGDERIIL
jgi:selenocysteine-specific elongation factor